MPFVSYFWKVARQRHNQTCGVRAIVFAVDDISHNGPSIRALHLEGDEEPIPQKAGMRAGDVWDRSGVVAQLASEAGDSYNGS